MFTFYRDNGILYTETKFDLVRPLILNGRKFEKTEEISFEDVELIERLLLVNANVLIRKEPGAEFEKPNLYDFSMALDEKSYEIIDELPTKFENSFKECKDLTSDINVPETMTDLNNSFNEENVEEIDEDDVVDDKYNNQNNNHQGKNRKKRNNNSQDGDK